MPPAKKSQGYDLGELKKLSEPLAFRVERIHTDGKREPIPLPQAEWSKEDGQRIEEIILNDVAGGGTYEGQVSDANGKGFTWRFAYDPKYFPAKVPQGVAGAFQQPPPPGAPPPAPNGGAAFAGAAPGTVWQPGVPQYNVYYPTPQQVPSYNRQSSSPVQGSHGGYPYQPPPAPFYGGYPPGYPPPYGAFPPTAPQPKESTSAQREIERLRAENQMAEHRREREAAEARHQQEIAAMREEMRRLAEATKSRGEDDPVLIALKQQNEILQKELADQKHRIDQQQKEAQWREELRRTEEQRQRDEQTRREEQRQRDEQHRREMEEIRRANENKTDPFMMMMLEQLRGASDAQREQMRLQAEQQRQQAAAAANAPKDLLSIVEGIRRTSGSDQLLANVASAYDGASGMMMRNMEMMTRMMGDMQGSPGWQLLGETLAGAKEAVSEVLSARQQEKMQESKVKEAEIHERMMREQAAAARMQADAMAREASQRQDAAAQHAAAEAQAKAEAAAQQHADAMQGVAQAHDEASQAASQREQHEQKIFGPALGEVQALRAFVAQEGPEPEIATEIAKGVVTAAAMIKAKGLEIPAWALLEESRYADLVDALLPGVPADFANICASEIERLTRLLEAKDLDTDPAKIKEFFDSSDEAQTPEKYLDPEDDEPSMDVERDTDY